MQNLLHFLNLLLFNVVLVAIPVVVAKATQFYRMRFESETFMNPLV